MTDNKCSVEKYKQNFRKILSLHMFWRNNDILIRHKNTKALDDNPRERGN